MMQTETPQVSVIVAAWNAEATIGRSIASALIQPEVCEVVVIDDGSTDATESAIHAADDGSGRIRIVRFPENRGPAAARNAGLAESTAPYVALLDADDFFLPDRFSALFALAPWDAVADNIGFVASDDLADFRESAVTTFDDPPEVLSLERFIEGNISRRGRGRGELGFVKPVMRRAFLDANALRYDESLRLGEDYALYTRMLARGAVFLTLRRCGYIAVERASSLSGQHRTVDLVALLASDRALERDHDLAPAGRTAVRRHRRQLEVKAGHRAFLDAKRDGGLVSACAAAARTPWLLPAIARAILQDKTARPQARARTMRYLL